MKKNKNHKNMPKKFIPDPGQAATSAPHFLTRPPRHEHIAQPYSAASFRTVTVRESAFGSFRGRHAAPSIGGSLYEVLARRPCQKLICVCVFGAIWILIDFCRYAPKKYGRKLS